MKNIFVVLFIGTLNLVYSQTITPSVINSGGSANNVTINGNPVIYTDNIGEAIIATGSNGTNILTQGFLQPNTLTVQGVAVTPFLRHVSCADKKDGGIRMVVENIPNTATSVVQYSWTPQICKNADVLSCSSIDSLSARTFTIKTIWSYTNTSGKTFSGTTTHIEEIKDMNGICDLKWYTGVTTKGSNNKFTIENIELYPNANVTIFNRWGKSLFSKKGYNNMDNYWPAKNEQVIPGTYFFIIELDGKATKGWLEVFD